MWGFWQSITIDRIFEPRAVHFSANCRLPSNKVPPSAAADSSILLAMRWVAQIYSVVGSGAPRGTVQKLNPTRATKVLGCKKCVPLKVDKKL
jgi:hypothetical protein